MSLFSFLKSPRYDKDAGILSCDVLEKKILRAFPEADIYLADEDYLALEDDLLLAMCRKVIWLPVGGYRVESNDCDNAAAIARGLILKYAAEHGFKRQPAVAEFLHEKPDGETHMALLMMGKSGRLIYYEPQELRHSYDLNAHVKEGVTVWG